MLLPERLICLPVSMMLIFSPKNKNTHNGFNNASNRLIIEALTAVVSFEPLEKST